MPSIFISAYDEPKLLEQAHEAHPLAYLIKPIRDSDLRQAIEFGIDRHRIEQGLRRELSSFRQASHIARQLPKVSSDELLATVAKEMKLLSGVMGPIAHHINNSLAAVVGYLSVVGTSPTLQAYERRFIDLALSECQKQKLFIQRLMWASESGAREFRPVTVESVVDRAVSDIRTLLRRGVELRCDPISPDLRIFVDSEACVHAIEGLLINAIHAIKDTGAVFVKGYSRHVDTVSALNPDAAPNTYAVIEVRDTGDGMTADEFEEMCTFFSTSDPDPKTEGLGLSVAYGVARSHRGWIELDSGPTQGTTIRMFLPLVHAH